MVVVTLIARHTDRPRSGVAPHVDLPPSDEHSLVVEHLDDLHWEWHGRHPARRPEHLRILRDYLRRVHLEVLAAKTVARIVELWVERVGHDVSYAYVQLLLCRGREA
eukprot:scaffold108783_cov84-Phaeocystis_antarctica.AAC.2